MSTQDSIALIEKALAKAKGKPVSVNVETHLLKDKVLDSLDSIRFLFELEELTKVHFTEEQANQPDTFKVSNLCSLIAGGRNDVA